MKVTEAGNAKEFQGVLNEMSLNASLRSPYLVNCEEVFERAGQLYVILEYVPDGTLGGIAQDFHSEYSEAFCKYSIWSIVQGLYHMHQSRVWHRDIKPANVLIDRKNRSVKIADLGLSVFHKDNRKKRATHLGTPYYAAPEILGGNKYTEKCDVFSLGCLAYELAMGYPPFANQIPKEFLLVTLKFNVLPISDRFSTEFKNFVARCCIKEPRDRPTIIELLNDPFLAGGGSQEC